MSHIGSVVITYTEWTWLLCSYKMLFSGSFHLYHQVALEYHLYSPLKSRVLGTLSSLSGLLIVAV